MLMSFSGKENHILSPIPTPTLCFLFFLKTFLAEWCSCCFKTYPRLNVAIISSLLLDITSVVLTLSRFSAMLHERSTFCL